VKVDRSGPKVGLYSVVIKSVDDPHMVRKFHIKTDPSGREGEGELWKVNDGFVVYAALLIKLKIDNVHFPRIYETNIHEGGSRVFRDWTMEALLEWNEVRHEELKELFHRYFEGEEIDNLMHEWDANSPADLAGIMAAATYHNDRSNVDIRIKDDEYRKAIDILHIIKSKGQFTRFDGGMSNLMFRRTSVGLQAVFSDPFSITDMTNGELIELIEKG
jgi:hypothetical protein